MKKTVAEKYKEMKEKFLIDVIANYKKIVIGTLTLQKEESDKDVDKIIKDFTDMQLKLKREMDRQLEEFSNLKELMIKNYGENYRDTLEDAENRIFFNGKRKKPKDLKHLKEIIKEEIKINGLYCDLNVIDTSRILDMSGLFLEFPNFNGDISKWDVSNVKNMESMFLDSKFEGDISKWNVSNVKNMTNMFASSNFNGDISNWNVSNVENMSSMFVGSRFNKDISKWDVSKVKLMKYIFAESKFMGDIEKWNPISLESNLNIFTRSEFEKNEKLPNWAKTKRPQIKNY